MSKRSKRRRDPAAGGGVDATTTPRAPDADQPSSSGRAGKGGQADSGGRGRPGEARQPAPGGRGGSAESGPPGLGGRGDRSSAPARPWRPAGRTAAPSWGLGVQLAFLVGVFAVVVLVAELAGAANLGVAFGIGQIGFAIAVIYLLVRR